MTSQHFVLMTPHRHMCDILCAADDVSSTLSPQITVFMMPHPLQAWYHTPCITDCTHCIFVITTSPLISHPLLNDITPTFCVTSYALYITSHPILIHHTTVLMASQPLYMKPHPVCRASYTLYKRHHSHYMDGVTSSISVTSYPLYIGHNLH